MHRSWISVLIVVALLVSGVLAGCGFPIPGTVSGSGAVETRQFNLADFNKLEVTHAFKVTVTQSATYSVNIIANQDLFQYLDVRKDGDTLHVGLRTSVRFIGAGTLQGEITMPDLRGIELSGASQGTVSGFNSSNELACEVSGASRLMLDNMMAGRTSYEISGASRASGTIKMADAEFDVSGASRAELAGSAANIQVEASGASNVELTDMTVRDARVNLSGASSATVNVGGRLDGELSGASRLFYMGNPTLGSINTSGASSISRK